MFLQKLGDFGFLFFIFCFLTEAYSAIQCQCQHEFSGILCIASQTVYECLQYTLGEYSTPVCVGTYLLTSTYSQPM